MRHGRLTLPELTLNVALVHSDWSRLGSPSPSSRGTSARVFGANYTSSIDGYRSPVLDGCADYPSNSITAHSAYTTRFGLVA